MAYTQPEPYKQEEYKGEFNLLAQEKELIIQAMSREKSDIEKAAERLGILPITLERKMPRHHIKREYFLDPDKKSNTNNKK